jgi:hypothetical protein
MISPVFGANKRNSILNREKRESSTIRAFRVFCG